MVPELFAPKLSRDLPFVAFLVAAAVSALSMADQVPLRDRAVDVLVLQNGTRLLGACDTAGKQSGGEIQIHLRGAWLKENAPELWTLAQQVAKQPNADAVSGSGTVEELLAEHLKTLRQSPAADRERIGFLQEKLDDILLSRKVSDNADVADVVILKLPMALVRRQLLQKPPARELAKLGILNEVPDLELMSPVQLSAALAEIPVGSRRTALPEGQGLQVQNSFARILLNADRIFGHTVRIVRFQGRLIPEDDDGANPRQLAAELLAAHMQAQVTELLGGVSPAGNALNARKNTNPALQVMSAEAIAMADRRQADVVEISEMELNPVDGAAVVRIEVYHRSPETKTWQFVDSVSGAATSADLTEGQKQNIQNDPQVKQILDLFGAVGSSASAVSKAVSVGAAVETAQKRARTALSEMFSGAVADEKSLHVLNVSLNELPVADK